MDRAFLSCRSLPSVSFPESALTQTITIYETFYNCSSLTSITFPEGALTQVTEMRYAFRECSVLTSLSFPQGALTQAEIVSFTFYQCSALQDLTIYNLPNINLTAIGFNTCTSLTLSSLQNIVNALPTTTSGYQCTLGATNLAKLSETDIQIATDKGWTLN